ncbi:MAG: helix-hairpin-helix domain-containing protein, partial [Candidatus Woesearchaeota archaeon]
HKKEWYHVRIRCKYGVKEELLPLLRFKGIGRKRARILYNNGLQTVGAIQASSIETLSHVVGQAIAQQLKEQVNQHVDEVTHLDSYKDDEMI